MTSVYDEPTRRMRVIVDDRIKQRWIDARRSEGRHRLRLLLAGAGLVALVGGSVGAVHSPLLEVRHVRVSGTGGVSAAQVAATAGVAHEPMIDVHAAAVAARLEAIPTVASARVEREWLGTVRIALTSRRAVAQAIGVGQVAELDATGRVLSYHNALVPGLPVIDGLTLTGLVPGESIPGTAGPHAVPGAPAATLAAAPPSVAAAAVALCAVLPAAVLGRIQAITVSGATLQASVTSGPGDPAVTVLLGDQSDLATKLTALATLVQQVDLTNVGQIDLRVPQRPALTPR